MSFNGKNGNKQMEQETLPTREDGKIKSKMFTDSLQILRCTFLSIHPAAFPLFFVLMLAFLFRSIFFLFYVFFLLRLRRVFSHILFKMCYRHIYIENGIYDTFPCSCTWTKGKGERVYATKLIVKRKEHFKCKLWNCAKKLKP